MKALIKLVKLEWSDSEGEELLRRPRIWSRTIPHSETTQKTSPKIMEKLCSHTFKRIPDNPNNFFNYMMSNISTLWWLSKVSNPKSTPFTTSDKCGERTKKMTKLKNVSEFYPIILWEKNAYLTFLTLESRIITLTSSTERKSFKEYKIHKNSLKLKSSDWWDLKFIFLTTFHFSIFLSSMLSYKNIHENWNLSTIYANLKFYIA